MEELSIDGHDIGRFSLTGWAGLRSLSGLLLRPVSLCVFTANID
jgi:hypothetical protein